jgi:serine/threonine protein kinase
MHSDSTREEMLFAAALELPVEARRAWLEQECPADGVLRDRVLGLLRAHDQAGGFMESPAPGVGPLRESAASASEPERIDRYRLRERLGEGGCGVVYLAEQEEPVRRRVALKVIKLGMDTREVIARFEAERQALALMDHPNIAHVLDAGATRTGRPYFVMELVRGIPITKYCDQHRLPTKVRLGLFIQVCRAVQHAHQKGIIHRDLKPSNILVSLCDNIPVPKIIDFGIAKATQGRLTDRTLFTTSGQFIGTPAYMSPEQADLCGLDIDTRSDIYSLGALLYELLTGRPPFEPKALAAVSLEEVRRTLRETDPARPSDLVAALPAAGRGELAWLRGGNESDLPGELRGDLDWIVMRALEKNRTRRYETANGLAADVERYQLYEPVVARPPSTLYALGKFTRRHRPIFVAAAALVVVLAVAAGVSLREAIRSARAEREQARLRGAAETAAARSEQVARFLKDMLKDADALVALGHDTRLLAGILDLTTARLGRDLREQPEVRADLGEILGALSLNLGDFRRAETLFGEALAVRQRLRGQEHAEVARSLNHLGMVLGRLGRPVEAEDSLRRAAAMQERLLGPDHGDLAETLGNLGVVLAQRNATGEAVATIQRALALQEKRRGRESVEVARALKLLGTVLEENDRPAEAEQCLRDALAINRRLLGERHPEVASTMQLLGVALVGLGRYTEALELYIRTVAIRQRLPEAAGHSAQSLIAALEQQGTLAELDRMLLRTVESTRLRHGRDSLQVAYWLAPRVYVLLREGKYAEAEPAARECLAIRQRLRPDDWSTYHARSMLGGALAGQGRAVEAESWLISGYEGLLRHRAGLPPENATRPAEAAQRLVELYTATGRPERAAEWRAKLAALLPPAGPESGRN